MRADEIRVTMDTRTVGITDYAYPPLSDPHGREYAHLVTKAVLRRQPAKAALARSQPKVDTAHIDELEKALEDYDAAHDPDGAKFATAIMKTLLGKRSREGLPQMCKLEGVEPGKDTPKGPRVTATAYVRNPDGTRRLADKQPTARIVPRR
jgi:hypothetical protein